MPPVAGCGGGLTDVHVERDAQRGWCQAHAGAGGEGMGMVMMMMVLMMMVLMLIAQKLQVRDLQLKKLIGTDD